MSETRKEYTLLRPNLIADSTAKAAFLRFARKLASITERNAIGEFRTAALEATDRNRRYG